MRANISYMLKNWIAWDKKSLVYFLIRVPALVFQPIVTAYIPKAMIDCIEKGVTTRQLILVVALLSLLLTITIWLDPFMKELILGGARIVRMRYAVAAFEKNLSTDYANIENLEMREKQKRAEVFYNGRYAGGSNFISTLNLFFVAVVGVVASGVLIYKINIWMILLIIATCGAQFCLQRALTKKQRQNLDQRTEPAAKFDYFYKLCKDGTAALDPIAENQLYLKYSELTDGKLSFFISHRLSSTRFCDRILFMSGGQITEMGTHEELMAKKGAYYKMFQVQSYYYREQGVAVHA